jgi:pyruvate/2-oxoglutarate dehydrogenase complex dihydrolipoamide acyltransferase (E2) component
MPLAIKLPDMGTNVAECKVLTWRVQEGQPVKRGDILADIETDKAVAELESTAEGVLLRHVVKAGAVAEMGEVLAYVGHPGEPVPGSGAAPAPAGTPAPVSPAAPTAQASAAAGPRPQVSPMVRNLAARLGVDITLVHGTGAGGIITRDDVLNAGRK